MHTPVLLTKFCTITKIELPLTSCDPLEQFDLINFFFSFNNSVIFLLVVSVFCIFVLFSGFTRNIKWPFCYLNFHVHSFVILSQGKSALFDEPFWAVFLLFLLAVVYYIFKFIFLASWFALKEKESFSKVYKKTVKERGNKRFLRFLWVFKKHEKRLMWFEKKMSLYISKCLILTKEIDSFVIDLKRDKEKLSDLITSFKQDLSLTETQKKKLENFISALRNEIAEREVKLNFLQSLMSDYEERLLKDYTNLFSHLSYFAIINFEFKFELQNYLRTVKKLKIVPIDNCKYLGKRINLQQKALEGFIDNLMVYSEHQKRLINGQKSRLKFLFNERLNVLKWRKVFLEESVLKKNGFYTRPTSGYDLRYWLDSVK